MGLPMHLCTDCLELDYGHLNQDGYVRILDKPRSQGGKLKMAHRQEWEKVNGTIPEGYEINHKCKNRRCVNLEHLECLEISKHRSLDNSLRYKDRELEILEFIKNNPGMTQRQVGNKFGLSQAGISSMVRRNNDR